MNTSSTTTRFAGAAPLGSLTAMVATIGSIPRYDAREAYFAQSLPALFTQQAEWAAGNFLEPWAGCFPGNYGTYHVSDLSFS